MKKRMTSLLMALCMVLSVLPLPTQAEEAPAYYCGKAAHVHTDSCTKPLQTCQKEAHTHTDGCYAQEKVRTCTLPDTPVHTEECPMDGERYLCTHEDVHVHSEACDTLTQVTVCTIGEHTHDVVDCYAADQHEWVCGFEEEHTHSEACQEDPNAPGGTEEKSPAAEDPSAPSQEGSDSEEDASQARIAAVQALIDALPSAQAITEENRKDVEAQLTAIDSARAALPGSEPDQLDYTKYSAVLTRFAELDNTQPNEPVAANLSGTYSEGEHTFDNYPTIASGTTLVAKGTAVLHLPSVRNNGTILIQDNAKVYFSSMCFNNGTITVEGNGKLILDDASFNNNSVLTAAAFIETKARSYNVYYNVYYGNGATAAGELNTLQKDSKHTATYTVMQDTTLTSPLALDSRTYTLKLNANLSIASNDSAAISLSSGATLNVEGSGTLTTSAPIAVSGGTLTWGSGNLSSSGTAIAAAGGTVNINGGTVSGKTAVQQDSGQLNISGTPTIRSSESTFEINGGSRSIKGGSYPKGITITGTQNVTLKSLIPAEGTGYYKDGTRIREGLDATSLAAGENAPITIADAVIPYATVTIDGVTTEYDSLQDAFDAASGKTATVHLEKDCMSIYNRAFEIDQNTNITLYMNGKKITGQCYNGILRVHGNLTIMDNGTIDGYRNTVGIHVSANGSLTTQGNVFFSVGTSEQWALDIYGTVNLNNGTISTKNNAIDVKNGGTLNVEGNANIGGKASINVSVGGTANVSGGTVSSKIVNFGTLRLSQAPKIQAVVITDLTTGMIHAAASDNTAYTGGGVTLELHGNTTPTADQVVVSNVNDTNASAFTLRGTDDFNLARGTGEKANSLILAVPTYTVTVPTDTTYTITPAEGSASPVTRGGSYQFTLSLAEHCEKLDTFAVKANGTDLTPDEAGVYTISNITQNQTITVEGVFLPPIVARVEHDGQQTAYRKFNEALAAASAASGSTLTLIENVTLTEALTFPAGTYTLHFEDHILQAPAATVPIGANVTFSRSAEGGSLYLHPADSFNFLPLTVYGNVAVISDYVISGGILMPADGAPTVTVHTGDTEIFYYGGSLTFDGCQNASYISIIYADQIRPFTIQNSTFQQYAISIYLADEDDIPDDLTRKPVVAKPGPGAVLDPNWIWANIDYNGYLCSTTLKGENLVLITPVVSSQSGPGGTWFYSLEEALEASTRSCTLTLLEDATLTQASTISKDVTFVIPEGKTLTVAEDVVLTNNGTLTNKGTINFLRGETDTAAQLTNTAYANAGTIQVNGQAHDCATASESGEETCTPHPTDPSKHLKGKRCPNCPLGTSINQVEEAHAATEAAGVKNNKCPCGAAALAKSLPQDAASGESYTYHYTTACFGRSEFATLTLLQDIDGNGLILQDHTVNGNSHSISSKPELSIAGTSALEKVTIPSKVSITNATVTLKDVVLSEEVNLGSQSKLTISENVSIRQLFIQNDASASSLTVAAEPKTVIPVFVDGPGTTVPPTIVFATQSGGDYAKSFVSGDDHRQIVTTADGRLALVPVLTASLQLGETDFTEGNATYNGSPISLSVSWKDAAVTAGTDYTVAWKKNGETVTTPKDAGTYTYTITGAGDYAEAIPLTGTLTIQPKQLTVTTSPTAKENLVYSGSAQALVTAGASSEGGEIRYQVNGGAASASVPTMTNAGTYTISYYAHALDSNHISSSTQQFTVEIQKAPISALAMTWPGPVTLTYGDKLSAHALAPAPNGTATFRWTSPDTVPTVGTATANVTATLDDSLALNYEKTGTSDIAITVTRATPEVSMSLQEIQDLPGNKCNVLLAIEAKKVNHGGVPTGDVTIKHGNTQLGTVTLVNGAAAFTWENVERSDTPYILTAEYGGDSNYAAPAEAATLQVSTNKQAQAAIAITAPGTKTYGDTPFALTVTGGTTNGQVTFQSSNSSVLTFGNDGKAVIHGAGEVTITATMAGNDRYLPVSTTIVLNIAQRALTVTAQDATAFVGADIPALNWTATGLVNGDTFTSPTITTNAKMDQKGSYDILISGGTLSNAGSYHVTYTNGTLHVVLREYTIIQGARQTVRKGNTATFVSDAPYSKFAKQVLVDGVLIDRTDYSHKEGSTVVTLHAGFVKTLSRGTHSLTIISDDGEASTIFTVKSAPVYDSDSPQTGDTTNSGLWLALALVGLVGLIVSIAAKKRYRKTR